MSDLRQAFRTLTKAPLLSAVIILSLALGIGANTVVFSWLNGVLLRPLAGATATVVCLEPRNSAGGYMGSSWLEYGDLQERLPAFSGIAAHLARTFNLGENRRGDRVRGEFVSGNFFHVLGVRPALGRFFRADEAAVAGGSPVAVISHQFWQRHFGADVNAIGRTVTIDDRDLIYRAMWGPRTGATLMSVFGAIALLLASLGIYAVMSHAVVQRTREIGIRLAIGAPSHSVLGLIIKRGALVAGVGLLAGLVAFLGLTRYIRSFLFEIHPTDPATFALVLGSIALFACYLPARHATRVDPFIALRSE